VSEREDDEFCIGLMGSISQKLALEIVQRRRERGRDNEPLSVGSLFDETTRNQKGLL
jgi:hypothetical protein